MTTAVEDDFSRLIYENFKTAHEKQETSLYLEKRINVHNTLLTETLENHYVKKFLEISFIKILEAISSWTRSLFEQEGEKPFWMDTNLEVPLKEITSYEIAQFVELSSKKNPLEGPELLVDEMKKVREERKRVREEYKSSSCIRTYSETTQDDERVIEIIKEFIICAYKANFPSSISQVDMDNFDEDMLQDYHKYRGIGKGRSNTQYHFTCLQCQASFKLLEVLDKPIDETTSITKQALKEVGKYIATKALKLPPDQDHSATQQVAAYAFDLAYVNASDTVKDRIITSLKENEEQKTLSLSQKVQLLISALFSCPLTRFILFYSLGNVGLVLYSAIPANFFYIAPALNGLCWLTKNRKIHLLNSNLASCFPVVALSFYFSGDLGKKVYSAISSSAVSVLTVAQEYLPLSTAYQATALFINNRVPSFILSIAKLYFIDLHLIVGQFYVRNFPAMTIYKFSNYSNFGVPLRNICTLTLNIAFSTRSIVSFALLDLGLQHRGVVSSLDPREHAKYICEGDRARKKWLEQFAIS